MICSIFFTYKSVTKSFITVSIATTEAYKYGDELKAAIRQI